MAKRKLNYRDAILVLKWCDEDTTFKKTITGHNSRTVLINEIHKNIAKYKLKRSCFKLNKEEIEYINKNGLMNIKNDIQVFLETTIKNPYKKSKLECDKHHPYLVTRYAVGVCCRNCLEHCYNINTWITLEDDDIEKLTSLCMKWVIKNSKIEV